METTETILVIFLSSALAVFLILSIIIAVKLIRLVDTLKKIADKAETIADKAESLSDIFRKTATPLAVGRLMAHLADSVFGKSKKKKGK